MAAESNKPETTAEAEAAAAETPEEGFVPYATEAAAEKSEKRQRRKKRILLVLVILLVIFGIILILGAVMNRYRRTMRHLGFDYRSGETQESNTTDLELGTDSRRLAEQAADKAVHIRANMYLMDESHHTQDFVSEYDYRSTSDQTSLLTYTADANAYFSSKTELRSAGTGYERKEKDGWKMTYEMFIPDLRDYCFGTEDHDTVTLECYDGCNTMVNGKLYHCEVWLMSEQIGEVIVYNTIYRYFSNGTLAGVILLRDTDDLLEVYDIMSYEFE